MKISGFTIIRNAVLFDFPIVECINSVIDLVDEFVVVAGDSSDGTDDLLAGIDSPKLRIVRSDWDLERFCHSGTIYAHQTDIALRECRGDWCFYIQSDEVMHESGLDVIRKACTEYLDQPSVEGFVLKYVHMYGDYKHYIDNLHFAYPREIRIVRNRSDIHSWRDAQSFRVHEDFDDMDYMRKERTRKLRCIELDATMFHYGWSRDPRCMVGKVAAQKNFYDPNHKMEPQTDYYDYGNLSMLPLYKGTQPKVMSSRIAQMSWGDLLRESGKRPDIGKRYGIKYCLINWVERNLMRDGRRLGGFKNYKSITPKR